MSDGVAQRKNAAERNALLELAAILTHDLSNPLQSITVLCELGLDEEELSEARLRTEQCLEAAERMRTLVHCYAGLVRNAGSTGPATKTLERLLPLLHRRFERHRITVSTSINEDFIAPEPFEFAVLVVLLGILRSASAGSSAYHVHMVVEQEGFAVSIDKVGEGPIQWATGVIEDVQAIVATEGRAHQEAGALRLAFGGAA